MPPLERLFLLEVEFHRLLLTQAPSTADASSLHTSYALQSGYELLIRQVGSVTGRDIERIRQRHALTGDPRDQLAARDSLKQLLAISPSTPDPPPWQFYSIDDHAINRSCIRTHLIRPSIRNR